MSFFSAKTKESAVSLLSALEPATSSTWAPNPIEDKVLSLERHIGELNIDFTARCNHLGERANRLEDAVFGGLGGAGRFDLLGGGHPVFVNARPVFVDARRVGGLLDDLADQAAHIAALEAKLALVLAHLGVEYVAPFTKITPEPAKLQKAKRKAA